MLCSSGGSAGLLFFWRKVMRIRNRTLLAVLTACALALAPSALRADEVVFTNFGPGDAYDTGVAFGIEPGRGLAMSFIPTDSGDLSKIEAALLNTSTAGNVPLTLRITDSLTAPSFTETFSLDIAPGQAIYTALSLVHPSLAAGSVYWLQAINNSNTVMGWMRNSEGDSGPVATSLDAGETWEELDREQSRGAFRVSVTPAAVPETSSVVLLASGLPAAGFFLLRRRAKRA
jgi:hypothetical protein